MKKKLWVIAIAVLIVAILTTATVYAKMFRNQFVERKTEEGLSEADAYNILALLHLSDENVSEFIKKKYRELGSWDAVAEFYGVTPEAVQKFVNMQIDVAKRTEIPDDIYAEMVEMGMTDEECRDFSVRTSNVQMDIRETWAAHKEGKSIMDVVNAKTEIKNAMNQVTLDWVLGKVNDKEYITQMQAIAPGMTREEILILANKEMDGWKAMRKESSGISDLEIEAAKRAGILNLFDACKLKDMEKFSDISFDEMVKQVSEGSALDDVIKNNLSQSKIDAARKENGTTTE